MVQDNLIARLYQEPMAKAMVSKRVFEEYTKRKTEKKSSAEHANNQTATAVSVAYDKNGVAYRMD